MIQTYLDLTLTLDNDKAIVEYLHPESGDSVRHEFDYSERARHYCNAMWDAEKKIGREIFDWFSVMLEEQEAY